MVLCPVIGKLLHKRVVLASASPRRQEILSNAGLRFEVFPSKFKEKLDKASFVTPYAYAMETAKQKALEVATRMHQKDLRTPDVVIGADTIVTVGGLILEKPVDKQDAHRMLSLLSGREHSVFTGVAIVQCSSKDHQLDTRVSEFYEETKVKFSELSEELLWEYIHSGEPMDKAGGYGIQALGGMLVESVHGDFLNVVGFPLNHFCKQLVELYYPPRPEDPYGSIPTVDTFEDLSDVERGGSEPAQRDTGSRDEKAEAGAMGQATAEAECHRTRETLPPFPTRLLELIDGFKLSKALFTACKLKVFDLLKDEAPQKAADIASKVDASASGTERLLDVCAAMGVLEKTEQGYSNTETANLYLASDGEYSLHGFIMQNNDLTWNLFTYLEFAIREGRNQYHRALGKKAEDPFQDVHYQSPETRLRFMQAMHGMAKLTARQVATAFDLSCFSSACDVGAGRRREEYSPPPLAWKDFPAGCTGALAQELAREYPHLQVTVFDLPDITELAAHFQPAGPQAAQIHFAAGDFFRDPLPSAELYVLCRILHDWPDAKVHKLLSRVAASCKPGAGLLLVETLLDEEEREVQGALIQSLNMLVQNEGRVRSPGEYQCLLELHGFRQVQVVHLGGVLDAVLATKMAP
ncbi:probable bifunctional dTTP/UTP pyrophosphatase/methyltransferase protein isoform X2 [Nomascus leucogenys]|uniref:probable bifunctional dTTP/UTP pyrophosphatase/methyltransferase protein isoform X2 n=1 Tax=Nomascus leucogenys TaxID=61853 RepID=UPI00122D95B8|nr:probable bifunctional dTTP/UTP pyrophosphatase/methyltransferase protein isoform X2 [Nomascus leucogenys]